MLENKIKKYDIFYIYKITLKYKISIVQILKKLFNDSIIFDNIIIIK